MKKFILVLLTVVSCSTAQTGVGRVFVSTEWLSSHLNDPNLVVLHVSFNRPEYQLAHIPGAKFLWYDWLVISTPDASTEMPAVTQADTVLESLGITDSSVIVLCFSGTNLSTTTRVFLALTYFGLGHQTSILDGGLEAWKSEKRPVSREIPSGRRTQITLQIDPSAIVDADRVKSALTDSGVVIVDARDKRFYDGAGGSISRTGHIKGAKSLPFSSVVDSTSRLKDLETIQKIFSDAGIRRDSKLFIYCHVGQQATLVYAAARKLGYDAAVYDGSFQDWSLRGEEYPVERPSTDKK